MLKKAKKCQKRINGFLSNQFSNKDNFLAHYETTGNEILEQNPRKKNRRFRIWRRHWRNFNGNRKRLKEEK